MWKNAEVGPARQEAWRRTQEEMQVRMHAVKGDMALAGARDEPFLLFCFMLLQLWSLLAVTRRCMFVLQNPKKQLKCNYSCMLLPFQSQSLFCFNGEARRLKHKIRFSCFTVLNRQSCSMLHACPPADPQHVKEDRSLWDRRKQGFRRDKSRGGLRGNGEEEDSGEFSDLTQRQQSSR